MSYFEDHKYTRAYSRTYNHIDFAYMECYIGELDINNNWIYREYYKAGDDAYTASQKIKDDPCVKYCLIL